MVVVAAAVDEAEGAVEAFKLVFPVPAGGVVAFDSVLAVLALLL